MPRAVLRAMSATAALTATLALAWFLAVPTANAADAREDVVEWLSTDGAALVLGTLGAPTVEPEDVHFGPPAQVWTWSESYLTGDRSAEAIAGTDKWASRITVDEAVIGGIVVDMSTEEADPPNVLWSATFGNSINAGVHRLVHDEILDAWFTLGSGMLRPVTEEAHAVLAGPLSVDLAQDFVRQWNGDLEPTETPVPVPTVARSNFVFYTSALILGVLALVGLVVSVRKGEG